MVQIQQTLNVLFSCGSGSWGGLEIITLQTALKLAESGAEIKLLCSSGSKLEELTRKSGINPIPFLV